MPSTPLRVLALAAAVFSLNGAAIGQGQPPVTAALGLCGTLESSFGPFDYRKARPEDIRIVERHHFTPEVENLQRGQSSTIAGDLHYTLSVFPNHHRALYSMMRLNERRRLSRNDGAKFPIECYFDRAIRFQPDDAQVRVLYAHYLTRTKRRADAERQLKAAEATNPTNPQIIYNIGLGFADIENYDKALEYAHKAYSAGVQFPGLQDKLKRAGQWREKPN